MSEHKEYYPGDTVSRYYYFKDKTGVFIDPTTTTCELYNPSGIKITPDPTLSKVELGKYEFNYTLASDAPVGIWHIVITGTKDTYTNKEKFAFEVVAVLL
jgi:uncharacterized protein YfaS (alpha-2-macroglobulin family)